MEPEKSSPAVRVIKTKKKQANDTLILNIALIE